MKHSLILVSLCFLLIGCEQKPQLRHYTEIIIEAPQSKTPISTMMPQTPDETDPHVGLDMAQTPMLPPVNNALDGRLNWVLPKGWKQLPAQGMRLASFQLINDPEAIDVSIVSLGGMAGGLQANLNRWLGQINVEIDDEALGNFIKSSVDNVFDFTQLQQDEDAANKSMMAAMLTIDDATVFVKMNGSIKAISLYKQDFLKLVKSIHLK